MLRRVALLFVVSALAFASETEVGAQSRLRGDGIAATVGSGTDADVVLHSDVELAARLAIASRTGDPFSVAVLPDSLLAAALDQILGELLIAREADRVQMVRAGRADRARELARIERSVGGPEALARFLERAGVTEDELRRVASRRALVAAFLRANLEGGGLREEPDAARVAASVERWVSSLRARTAVRVLAPYGRRG